MQALLSFQPQLQPDAKFTLIEKLTKPTAAEQLQLILNKLRNFWILKPKTLHPDDLNQELNDV